jgi:hypothetical protein
MKIQLFEKKYYKTKDHDGTQEIKDKPSGWLSSICQEDESYIKDEFDKVLETITTKTLDLASIKKEFPQCVKVKIGDLYIKL